MSVEKLGHNFMMSCLIIASNFPPVHSAGVYRTVRIVKYLLAHNWNLSVLTLDTNTLPAGTKVDANLLGQVDDSIEIFRAPAQFPIERFNQIFGRNQKSRKTNSSTVSVATRIDKEISESPSISLFQRLKDRVTIPWMTPDRLVGWVRPAAKLGIATVKKNKPELLYSSGPPWSNHLVGSRVVAATGIPWVADFRDPWGGNAFRPSRGEDTWAGRQHRRLELEVYRAANVVIFNTDRARQDAIDRTGEWLADKSIVIPNGFDPACFVEIAEPTSVASSDGPLRMIHAGAFYGQRNIDSLLLSIGELKRSCELESCDFQLELVGTPRPHEQKLVDEQQIQDFVTFVPAMPHRDCLQRLSSAHVLLLVQTGAPLCVPGKLYEYIALNKPIFTLSGAGSTADLVAKEGLGHCIDPNNVPQLKSALSDLLQQYRADHLNPPNSSSRSCYDGKKQMTLFDNAFRRAIASRSSSSSRSGDSA